MIRLLFSLFLFYIAYKIITAIFSKKNSSSEKKEGAFDATNTHKDPVCGVYISEDDAVVGRMNGERIYFCSRECLDKFQNEIENQK